MARDQDPAREETPSRADLVDAWTRDHGRPPPKGLSSRLLRLSAAWHEQAAVYGGLSSATRRRLAEIMGYPARPIGEPCTAPAPSRRPDPVPGTRLVREWQGQSHVVDVGDGYVTYEGRTYRSLSAVARAITGARWSGPRFFGLRDR